MKPSTRERIDKAEADFSAALILRRSRKQHTRDIVCFHFQQCIEKYLKGRLIEAGIAFTKTHDLEKLLDLALPIEPAWALLRPELGALTDFAVESRYPGKSATAAEATKLTRSTTRIRGLIRQSLGLA